MEQKHKSDVQIHMHNLNYLFPNDCIRWSMIHEYCF